MQEEEIPAYVTLSSIPDVDVAEMETGRGHRARASVTLRLHTVALTLDIHVASFFCR